MSYALTATVHQAFAPSLAAAREALAEQGFGVLTEIDIRATLKAKLDVDVPPQVILGACRPPLAHAALQAEPSVGLLLPCNVVVRAVDDDTTLVEALDPAVMVTSPATRPSPRSRPRPGSGSPQPWPPSPRRLSATTR